MYGLYDKEGILRFVDSDKDACIAYAELFEIGSTNYCLMDLANSTKKERFYLEVEKKSWTIDSFKENNYPLEIAEIELSNEEEDLFLPSFISKEITGLTHYSNFSLAKNPFSQWE